MGRARGGSVAEGREKKSFEAMPPKKAAAALHPPYEQMVKAALVALKDRTGSSAQAIAKYMRANFKGLPENMPKQLSKCLKKKVVKKKVVKKKPAKKKADPKKKAAPKK